MNLRACLRYEISQLKLRKKEMLVFFALLFCLLTFLSLLPLLLERGNGLVYPSDKTKEEILASYQNGLDALLTSPHINETKTQIQIHYLQYFLNSGTTQYDYLTLGDLCYIQAGAKFLAFSFSLLEGGAYVCFGLATLASLYFVVLPYERGNLRLSVLSGTDRRRLWKAKTLLGLPPVLTLASLMLAISFILGSNALGQQILFMRGIDFIAVPVWNILLSRYLGIMLGSTFFFFLVALVGLVSKRSSVALAVAILLFSITLLFLGYDGKWGYRGELTEEKQYLAFLLLGADFLAGSSYGFVFEATVFFPAAAALDTLLLLSYKKRFLKVPL